MSDSTTAVIATPVIAQKKTLPQRRCQRPPLARHHRRRRDEQSDAAEEDVYDENRLEDAIHVQPSFFSIEADRRCSIATNITQLYIIKI
ncbi:MAG: hypothetical protein M3Q89_04805 [Verrucomicrobiota bacterium]|nr:hypothetical protein [Verrucomicrobiota bacterium]